MFTVMFCTRQQMPRRICAYSECSIDLHVLMCRVTSLWSRVCCSLPFFHTYSMFIISFLDIEHREFVSKIQTDNREFYYNDLKRLREAVQRKRPHLWRTKNWNLHNDNAQPFPRSLLTGNISSQKNNIVSLPQSPDLAPAGFYLFSNWKCN